MNANLNIHEKHILIVDDNITNIILMQAILEESQFKNFHSASSAIEAYEVLENNSIDMILMDVTMPEIDGLEATQAIKSNKKYSHIPIIMVTAIDDDETLKKSFELGAIDFIRKPVNQVELIARLNNTLESQIKDTMLMHHSRFEAMEEIISMLAHQWRQPLGIISAIIGTLQTQKELDVLDDNELTLSLEKMNKYTNELSDMITTFREFFKTDSDPTISSPNEAVYEVQRLMQESLKHHHIQLELELGDMKPLLHVQNLLVLVLSNIITNSKEAFTKNLIKNPKIIIRTFTQKGKTNIVVQDNAGGVKEDVIGHIFEPYFTTKQERNGKGLGLFLSKSIINQQFNGNIYANSKDQKTEVLISF